MRNKARSRFPLFGLVVLLGLAGCVHVPVEPRPTPPPAPPPPVVQPPPPVARPLPPPVVAPPAEPALPQGSSTALAPSTRSRPMSNGSNVRPADARPMTMNPVQMATVTTAAAMPVARGERRMGGLSAALRPGIRARGRAEP